MLATLSFVLCWAWSAAILIHIRREDDDDTVNRLDSELAYTDELSQQGGKFQIVDTSDRIAAKCGRCMLKACNFHDATKSPLLYVAEHTDGIGHRMLNIIKGMAFAAKNNMTFGGAWSAGGYIGWHETDSREEINMFFGDKEASKNLFVDKKACEFRAECNDNVLKLLKERKYFKAGEKVSCGSMGTGYLKLYDETFTPSIQKSLRSGLDKKKLLFKPKRRTMALHVRRGDLKPGDPRATPTSWFLQIVEEVRKRWPDVDVHAFSCLGPKGGYYGQHFWKDADFDEFRAHNVTVHLDEVGPTSMWAHAARADVFVMSASAFSIAPALLNQKCVVGAPNGGPRLSYFVDGRDTKANMTRFHDKLSTCMSRVGK